MRYSGFHEGLCHKLAPCGSRQCTVHHSVQHVTNYRTSFSEGRNTYAAKTTHRVPSFSFNRVSSFHHTGIAVYTLTPYPDYVDQHEQQLPPSEGPHDLFFHLMNSFLRRPRQIVACLASTDHGIRLAAAELVRALARDAFCSKSIVFPEAVTSDDGKLSSSH